MNDSGMPNISRDRQDPILIAVGSTIRRIRLSKNISQEELAHLAGVDRSYMGAVERGDNNVAILKLARVAAALGISVSKLLKEAGL